MSDVALRMEHVYKKFRKGEVYNSLRDLLPALTGRMFRQLEINDDDKRDFWALQDISFDVRRGEALGIIGPNGAGKSTILKILSRIMKPTRGTMHVAGRLSALIEVSAGFHQDLTGRENIYLNGTILGMTRREIDRKLDQIIEFSGIEEFIDTPVKRYSSGMYARLGFSVAAHVNPDILIVDEVLSVGDYVFQLKCLKRMKEVVAEGASVLFVSHNLKSVAEFCSRALLLKHGQMAAIGPTQEVISSYMHQSRSDTAAETDSRTVSISKVTVRNQAGPSLRFHSGEKAWIDVEVTAHKRCSKLSVTLWITDEHYENIFDTSTERLGHGNFNLETGELFKCTFELQLHLTTGVFHVSVHIYRYDTQTVYDSLDPAANLYLEADEGVRGIVNCAPRVIQHEIKAASESGVTAMIGGNSARGDSSGG
ncbi:MAG TPA: ABC transporter ATP-binding protein [Terracidiphilus sp.]|nr:ABC transporter ATP-binding protein [Terracidiphilus sp.]